LDLYAEDKAHEEFVGALLHRLSRENRIESILTPRSAEGGAPRMLQELKGYQKGVRKGLFDTPDLLVVAQDTNCTPWHQVRQTLAECIDKETFPAFVVACPDPHIERWFFADPPSFQRVIGVECEPGRVKCEKGLYKNKLRDALRRGGHLPTLESIEFALELVEAMDLYRAGKNESSLHHFLDELRGALALLVGRNEQVNSQDS
jgi:hypothetical protein